MPRCEPSETVPTDGGATVILGIGNLLHADDGVGVHAAHALLERGLCAEATVLDGGVAPLDALAAVDGVHRLIIVDAAELGAPPGTIRVLDPDDLLPRVGDAVSLHDLDLLWALNVLELTGRRPPEMVIVGVQPESLASGTELSPTLAARLDDVLEVVLAQIPARTGGCQKVKP